MNLKAAVVVLVGVVVAFMLVLFYGGVRPGGSSESGRRSVEALFGDLRGGGAVSFSDVDDAPCAARAAHELQVKAGTTCRVSLPSSGELRLCAPAGGAGLVGSVSGRDFPAQRVTGADLDCGAPHTYRLYDTDSVLVLSCAVGECRVRVG